MRYDKSVVAKKWFERGKKAPSPDEKLYCYERALKTAPNYAYAWNSKGNVLYMLGRFDEALGCYENALSIKYNFARAWVGKGNALRRLIQNSEALKCYDKSISFFPGNAYAWNGKGDALRALGQYKDAIKCYSKASKLKEDLSFPWNGKGFALYELGFYEEAINSFDVAIGIYPIFLYSWLGKGNSLCKLERYDEAIICYENVLRLNPEFDEANKGKKYAEDCLNERLSSHHDVEIKNEMLNRCFVKNIVSLTLLYAEMNDRPEVLNKLEELKDYMGKHDEELESSVSQLEHMLKHDVSIGASFVEGLKVLLKKIERGTGV